MLNAVIDILKLYKINLNRKKDCIYSKIDFNKELELKRITHFSFCVIMFNLIINVQV